MSYVRVPKAFLAALWCALWAAGTTVGIYESELDSPRWLGLVVVSLMFLCLGLVYAWEVCGPRD